jgi:CelD/BcsL family acetyltransferase involved in cellulose biosynthesis
MRAERGAARHVRLSAVDLLDDEEWSDALEGSGEPIRGSHRAGVGRAFEVAFPSYRFVPLRVSDSDGAAALFPMVRVARRLPDLSMALAMPLGLEGTPIAVSGAITAAHVNALFAGLEDCGQLQLSGGSGSSPPAVGQVLHQVTHVLDLTRGFDELWQRSFSGKNRNMCRKAERAGVSITCESSTAAVAAYHKLYARASAEWGYTSPPYPPLLFDRLVSSGVAELWIARLNGAVIGGALLLRGSEDLLYWSGAMDRDHRGAAPSNALIRAAIEAGCGRGLSRFDFGASGPLAGVQSFKESFGATESRYTVSTLSTCRFRALSAIIRAAGRGPRAAEVAP